MPKQRKFVKVFKDSAKIRRAAESLGRGLSRVGVGPSRSMIFELEGRRLPSRSFVENARTMLRELFPNEYSADGRYTCHVEYDSKLDQVVVICETDPTAHPTSGPRG